MRGNSIVPAEPLLEEGWQIVVVVDDKDLAGLSDTLHDVLTQSQAQASCSILAQDTESVRKALIDQRLPVDYLSSPNEEEARCWPAIFANFDGGKGRTLFVRSGVRLPVAWDARLVAVAQSHPNAAAVAPLHSQGTFFGAFSEPQQPPKLPVNAVDQWLNDYAKGREFSVPVMPDACVLLQGDYWKHRTAGARGEPQLCTDVTSSGYWVVATDQVYVDDSACVYAEEVPVTRQSIQTALITGFDNHHPLASMRHALAELCSRAERPEVERNCLPVQLHVGHSWGGGLNRWITNYLAADTSCHHLVLRSVGDRTAFGQQIALYGTADMQVPLRTWVLAKPILSTVVSQLEYAQLLAEVINEYNVETLVVSSVIGHSLDVLRSGLPTTVVLHDFFPFCPALYACFDSPCHTCDSASLKKCQAENPLYSFFDHEDHNHWCSIRNAFSTLLLESRPQLVAPTQSVLDRYFALQPSLSELKASVIPHGLADELAEQLSRVRSSHTREEEKLRVVVLGRLTREKGADLLADIAGHAAHFAQFYLLGCGDDCERFRNLDCCTLVEDYQLSELPGRVAKISPDVGLLLSVVPETFSYTLSELWAMGIPAVATNLGAFSDRIIDGENGWLVPPDPRQLSDRLWELAENRNRLEQVATRIASQPIHRTGDMVAHYNRVHPKPAGIPLRRFYLPRRSFQNPYLEVAQQDQALLYIQRTRGVEATYRGVLRDFLQFSALKASQTQRGPRILRLMASKALSLLAKAV